MLTISMRCSLKARFVGLGSSSSWTGDSAGASAIARSSSEGGWGSRLEGMFEGQFGLRHWTRILISAGEALPAQKFVTGTRRGLIEARDIRPQSPRLRHQLAQLGLYF